MAVNGQGRVSVARCDYCRKTVRANARAVVTPGGLLFDSPRCQKRYADRALVRGLANAVRVARSRLKTRTVQRAHSVYRTIGGRDWPKVKLLLGSVL